MNTLVIPKKLANKDDLIIVPRKKYEALLRLIKKSKEDWINEEPIKIFLKKRISKAENDFKNGKTIKWKI